MFTISYRIIELNLSVIFDFCDNFQFSMSDYKTMYNNTLMLERFMCVFAINPNTPKNQKIVKELLDYGKIAS